jgi:hypothetical protein
MSQQPVSRRRFLALLPGAGLTALIAGAASPSAALHGPHRRLGAPGWAAEHPDPRPGIDGAKVLRAEQLSSYPDLIPLFDGIREHAALADGVLCYCGCAELPGYRSLLTCFEEGFDMARFCPICQAQGRLLVGRAGEGQTLEQIRRAIDARYASGGTPRHHAR